jgi:hypothetical protein
LHFKVVDFFDKEDAICIGKSQTAFSDFTVAQDLAYIKANFSYLVDAIKMLEAKGLTITEVAEILSDVLEVLKKATGPIGAVVLNKFESSILQKNPGFKKIRQIGMILNGEKVPECTLPPNIISCHKFSPLTSVDVERSFSIYKTILSDRRTSFTHQNLEMYLVCNCLANYK